MAFDYQRAWKELARPQFEALDRRAKDLYLYVVEAAAEAEQDRDLLLPWPHDTLRRNFEALPISLLAHAARVIYFHGHWGPITALYQQGNGAYWRFANLADQVLRDLLGLPRVTPDGAMGAHVRVCEGFLRVCISTPNIWGWHELGLATGATLGRWALVPEPLGPDGPLPLPRNDWLVYEEALAAYVDQCVAELHPLAAEAIRPWLRTIETYQTASRTRR